MFLYNSPTFSIYFGDAQDNLYQHEYLALHYLNAQTLCIREPFSHVQQKLGLHSLIFLHQTHSIVGYTISQLSTNMPVFSHEGDFLVTNQQKVGLGVMTADCLPIVLYDTKNHAVGMVHAGWRGTVGGIAAATVARMQQEYGTQPADLQIFFGPSARACCYQVQPDFVTHIQPQYASSDVLHMRDGQLFFDGANYNKLLLQACGVRLQAINTDYNVCTICDESFFSFRRQGPHAGRQMTVVSARDQMSIVTLV